MDDARARRAGAVDPRQRHHPADRRAAGWATATRSSPASAAGAPRSAPDLLRSPSSCATCRRGTIGCCTIALIENIQRENLNPIDEARAYRRLADDSSLTQEHIAAAVGKDRASVANYLRLLKLPDEVRNERGIGPRSRWDMPGRSSRLTDAVAQAGSRATWCRRNLSVRETEALVKKALAPRTAAQPAVAKGRAHPRGRREAALRARHADRDSSARAREGGSRSTSRHEDELNRLYDQLTIDRRG